LATVPLADRPFKELLDQIAAQEPAPGGGSAAALTGATAAALLEMAAAFDLARGGPSEKRVKEMRKRGLALRNRLLELADADTRSYQSVLDAMTLDPGPKRKRALRAALSSAADTPFAIACAAAEVAELAAQAAQAGNAYLVGDATAAAVLAEAATRAAARLVEINLASSPNDPRHAEAADHAHRAWTARAIALELH
jgi:formiminotetrahydrofolate cyclodeaminase